MPALQGPEAELLRQRLKDAVKNENYSYLHGVWQVERAIGSPERVKWLEEKMRRIKLAKK